MAAAEPDSDRALELLDRATNAERRFSEPVFRWLRDGLRAHVDSFGTLPLDACLGLRPAASERTLARCLAEAKRTRAIVRAWRLQTDCEDLSAWRRCELLATELSEFATDFYPEWCAAGGPPSGASEWRRALFNAFAALDKPPPMSTAGVHRLLTRAGVLT